MFNGIYLNDTQKIYFIGGNTLVIFLEDFNKVSSTIVDECTNVIIKNLLARIGRKNIISVILTGSVARNHPTYKNIDGKVFLESDFDVVVVVNRKSIIRSLILIKSLARKLTLELRKKRLLSGVSLSVMTENSIYNLGPSIFYQDLKLNGKTIFGKNLCSMLTAYDINKIPANDVYKLVFNRMVETLQTFVSSATEKNIAKVRFDLVSDSISKLTFALIQAILIKNDILIFRGYNLEGFKTENFQRHDSELLDELLTSYKELQKMKETSDNFSEEILEYCWRRVIKQFNEVIEKLANIEDVTSESIKNLVSKHEKLSRRIKLSFIIFLQYFKMSSPVDLFRIVFYVLRFGSDYVYFPLYNLFLSTIKQYDMDENRTVNVRVDKPSLHEIATTKPWLKSFNNYFRIWKFITD